jgi:DNA-binding MarR family transcriptional regulator
LTARVQKQRRRSAAERLGPEDEFLGLELPARLRLAIVRTARRLRQESGTDLGPSQVAALSTIERHGPLAPSEVADREQIKRPTAARILARLEQAGLVERVPDPEDGRSAILSPTPEGRALIRRLRARKTAYLAKRLSRLGAEDVAVLERATELFEEMLEGDPIIERERARREGRR